MSDIVERLRERARYEARANNFASGRDTTMPRLSDASPQLYWRPEDFQSWKDANEVERLQNLVKEFERVLKLIDYKAPCDWCADIAKKYL